MKVCELCGSPTRHGEKYGESAIVCTNPECQNQSKVEQARSSMGCLATITGFFVGIILIILLLSVDVISIGLFSDENVEFIPIILILASFIGWLLRRKRF